MAYADVTVIVEGAVEEDSIFTDEVRLRKYIGQIEEQAKGDGYHTEVFILRHEHSPDVECECAQYVTDGRPAYEWNTSS
jgi:hypothetical protein